MPTYARKKIVLISTATALVVIAIAVALYMSLSTPEPPKVKRVRAQAATIAHKPVEIRWARETMHVIGKQLHQWVRVRSPNGVEHEINWLDGITQADIDVGQTVTVHTFMKDFEGNAVRKITP